MTAYSVVVLREQSNLLPWYWEVEVPLDWCSLTGLVPNPGRLAPSYGIFVGTRLGNDPLFQKQWQSHWMVLDGKTK